MRSMFLIVAGAVVTLAPALAAFDSMSLGIFGDDAAAIREQIVDGMSAAGPVASPVKHRAETSD